jgi:hypothetical protein
VFLKNGSIGWVQWLLSIIPVNNNPSYFEVEIEGSQFEASPGKKINKIPFSKNKPCVTVHAYNSSHTEGVGRRITV